MRSPSGMLLLLALAACSGPRPLPGDDAPTLASLAGRRVAVQADEGPPRDEARAAAAYRALLAAAPASSPHRGPALRRLADLEVDLAEQRSADGAAPDYRAAIARYRDWLATHPAAPDRDTVLYQLARAHEQGGDTATALATLDALVAAHPNSPHRDEAEFRRGELLFAARRWAEAEAAYSTVLQAGAGNPWLDRALYMQGWSRYRLGRWNEALESLFGVLDLKLGAAPDEPLPRAEQELVDDSLRVIALSLEPLQGAAAIAPHAEGERRRAYVWRVYEQLAQQYQRQGRVRDATEVWQRLAQAQPLLPRAALARQRVVQILDAAGFATLALQARQAFVQAHAPDGDWARAQPAGSPERVAAQTEWLAQVDTLARHHHAQAQQSRAAAEVDAAQHAYRLALRHGADGRQGERRFLLAELLFDAGRDADAVAAYDDAAYGDADHPRRADAAHGALLARGRLIDAAEGTARRTLQRQQVAASQRLVLAFAADARGPAVLAHAAELQWALDDGPAARTLAQQALQRPDAGADARRRAHTVLGDVALASGDAAGAEQAYAQVLALVPAGDAALRDGAATQVSERLATAIYRQGEAERDAGRAADAARHFARVGTQAPGSRAAAAALYDGALQFIAVKDWPAAVQALQALRAQHPQHALVASVPPQLALALAEGGRPLEAAQELERWSAALTDPAAARDARWQAAGLFDRGGDAPRALALLQRVQADAASPLPQVVQARWRLAEAARQAGRPRDEQALLRALREAEAQGGSARTEATRTRAAQATLRLAEPQLAAYRQLALVEPLPASLARKKARFDALQAVYAEVAALGSGEAQALALAHSAALYLDFGHAVRTSPPPRGLARAERPAYAKWLAQQARPFEDKAAELQRQSEALRTGAPVEQAAAPSQEPRR